MLLEFSFPSLGAHKLHYSNLQVQTPKEALEISPELVNVLQTLEENNSSNKTHETPESPVTTSDILLTSTLSTDSPPPPLALISDSDPDNLMVAVDSEMEVIDPNLDNLIDKYLKK